MYRAAMPGNWRRSSGFLSPAQVDMENAAQTAPGGAAFVEDSTAGPFSCQHCFRRNWAELLWWNQLRCGGAPDRRDVIWRGAPM